jgi:hypothetical protein
MGKLHIRKGLVQTVPHAVVSNNFDCVKMNIGLHV